MAGLQSFTVAPIIIATGKPAIALGGFSGADPIVNLPDVQRMIRSGEIRFFLLPSFGARIPAGALSFLPTRARSWIEQAGGFRGGFGGFGREGNNAVSRWISAHCRAVPPAEWRTTSVSSRPGFGFGFGGRGDAGGQNLYDCAAAS